MASNNAINLKSSGIVTYDGAGSFSASTVTNHGVVTAGASNTVTSVAPSTSGNVLTSDGTDWVSSAPTQSKFSVFLVPNATLAPGDATTYFVGVNNYSTTIASGARVIIPVSGTINTCYVTFWVAGTLSSSQTSTVSLRKNDTTDTTISSATTQSSASQTFSNTSMGLSVSAGDYIVVKWVTPTWTTNPTNLSITASFTVV